MNIVFYSSQSYDQHFFSEANKNTGYALRYLPERLDHETVEWIEGESVVCVFVNDRLDEAILTRLWDQGVRLVALRCAGYNNVDLEAANKLGMEVVNVPEYSPSAVAEHTVGLMLALNRHIPRAYSRVREGNFELAGLLGFDFNGRTAGIIGTGKIGCIVARILLAFGMRVLAYDPVPDSSCRAMGVDYVALSQLLSEADVISLHCPLTEHTRHLISAESIQQMKPGVMLINTGRGGILDTCAVLDAVKRKHIGYLGLDVYEQEADLFFKDLSCEIIQDDVFLRLLSFPNVLVTAHQAFFTSDALRNIADTTLQSVKQFDCHRPLQHALR